MGRKVNKINPGDTRSKIEACITGGFGFLEVDGHGKGSHKLFEHPDTKVTVMTCSSPSNKTIHSIRKQLEESEAIKAQQRIDAEEIRQKSMAREIEKLSKKWRKDVKRKWLISGSCKSEFNAAKRNDPPPLRVVKADRNNWPMDCPKRKKFTHRLDNN